VAEKTADVGRVPQIVSNAKASKSRRPRQSDQCFCQSFARRADIGMTRRQDSLLHCAARSKLLRCVSEAALREDRFSSGGRGAQRRRVFRPQHTALPLEHIAKKPLCCNRVTKHETEIPEIEQSRQGAWIIEIRLLLVDINHFLIRSVGVAELSSKRRTAPRFTKEVSVATSDGPLSRRRDAYTSR
jgi:hypothetical protein